MGFGFSSPCLALAANCRRFNLLRALPSGVRGPVLYLP